MPSLTAAPQVSDTRHAPAPQPAFNRRYEAIGNTLRYLQDGRAAVEILTDDDGKPWALPAHVLNVIMARAELALARRTATESA